MECVNCTMLSNALDNLRGAVFSVEKEIAKSAGCLYRDDAPETVNITLSLEEARRLCSASGMSILAQQDVNCR